LRRRIFQLLVVAAIPAAAFAKSGGAPAGGVTNFDYCYSVAMKAPGWKSDWTQIMPCFASSSGAAYVG